MSNCDPPITVFWRPGCGFCSRLRRGLKRAGVVTSDVNIWEHPDAAAAVRLVADGNETVPTVTVGTVVMVNPSVSRVLAEIESQAPGKLRVAVSPVVGVSVLPRSRLEILQWSLVIVLLFLSFVAEAYGQTTLSWVIDGLNVALYFVLKKFRHLRERV